MQQPTVDTLIDDLDSDDTDTRVAARDALRQCGAAAVAPLVAALTRPASMRAWSMYRVTIHALGRTAFGAVVEALAAEAGTGEADPAPARRLRGALCGFGVDCLAEYAAALRHESAVVRAAAVAGMGGREAAALPYVGEVLPLLGDADPEVRDCAVRALERMGPEAVPPLRHVRRSGPGGWRRGALTVLAELGDPYDLEPADQAAIRRLIGIKQLDERPEPITACFLSWIAVRTGDQAGLIDLLGLSAPEPATFTLGTAAADSDSHGFEGGPPYPQYARVFVTPELDGWTLVVGRWCCPVDEDRSDDVARVCQELSARFGAAQAYFYGAQGDGSAWLVAEHGVIVRRAADNDEAAAGDPGWEIGEPLPFEQRERARLVAEAEGENEDFEFEWEFALREMAPNLAAVMSVNPLDLTPSTPVRGRGVLALTPYGAVHGAPPGALPI